MKRTKIHPLLSSRRFTDYVRAYVTSSPFIQEESKFSNPIKPMTALIVSGRIVKKQRNLVTPRFLEWCY